jgi:MFS family permease
VNDAYSATVQRPSSRAGYVLAVLAATYAVNFLDRQVVNILAESIKRDLQISDTQLGLLTGTAFGLFYSLLGLPIARLADRYSRVRIITIALALWSALTAACGIAQNYVQLFLMRLGVGVGEAGGTPPAQSLIADYFPQEQRTFAMAVFALGLPFGSFCGFLLGGIVDAGWGWRTAFVIAGVPGVFLAVLVALTLKEPPRGMSYPGAAALRDRLEPAPLRVSLAEIFARRSFIRLVLGGTCGIFIVYVTNAWLPSFLIRLHGLDSASVGGWIAFCVGVGGLIGSLGGGWLATRLKRRFARAEVWMIATSTALTAPALLWTLFASSTQFALAGMFVLYALSYVWIGPTSALIQRVTPIRSRTLAAALQLSIANVIAMLFGPPSIGYLSDRLQSVFAVESLRYALGATAIVSILGAAVYWSAGRHLLRDLESGDG